MAKKDKSSIFDTQAFQTFKRQPWFREWEQAMKAENMDIEKKLTLNPPNFWVFLPKWGDTREDFDKWDKRNSEWIRIVKG